MLPMLSMLLLVVVKDAGMVASRGSVSNAICHSPKFVIVVRIATLTKRLDVVV